MNCKNCNANVIGSFCHSCGQKADTHRINFHEIVHDFIHSVWHVDKGFIYTFLKLVKHPRTSIRGYLEGKRVNFLRPFAYLIITSALSLLFINLQVSMTEKGEGNMRVEQLREELQKQEIAGTTENDIEKKSTATKIGYFLHKTAKKYLGFLLFGLVPFLALSSFWFFKEAKYNYWEHLTVYTYVVGQLNIVFLFLTFLSIGKSQLISVKTTWFSFSALMDMGLILILAVLSIYTYQVFHEKNKLIAVLKSLILPIVALVMTLGCLGVFM